MMDAGYRIGRKVLIPLPIRYFHGSSSSSGNPENLDRFIPNRSAMNFGFARYMLTQGSKGNKIPDPNSLSDKEEDYRKRLAEALDMNRTRIFSFKNKPPMTTQPSSSSSSDCYYCVVPQPSNKPLAKRRRCIPQNPERTLDLPDLIHNFCLNLLDWGSSNVISIALSNSVYLWNASTRSSTELLTVDDGLGPVTSVSWAPDGKWIAVGLHNSQVQLWDSTSMKKLRTLRRGHFSGVGSLAWNNQDILTTGAIDSLIINNDIRIRSHAVQTYRGHTQEVCGLKWSDSGRHLASGGRDNLIHIWDMSSSNALHRFEEHTDTVKALAWCPFQANLLASGGGEGDRTIKFWNCHTGACLNSINTGSQVSSLLWNKKERELLSAHGFNENQLTLWNYPSMEKMAELRKHTSPVLFMAGSPNNCTVASVGADERMMFWNVFGAKAAAPKANPEPFSHVSRIR